MHWRARGLENLWSWLLAFRAVAETSHLPTASAALNVSASALSRTIRLLEGEVGQPLFDRVGRNIALNAAGETLLIAVRDAMRLTDDGVATLRGRSIAGPVAIAVPGPYAPIFVLPALARLRESHPDLEPRILAVGDINNRLLQGRIDLALVESVVADPELITEPFERMSHGVFCGDHHPLRRRRKLTLDEVAGHPFAAPVTMADGRTPDQWPDHLHRRIGLRVHQMQVAIDACVSQALLAVLPGPIGAAAGLRQLPVDIEGTTTLFAVRRKPLGSETSADLVLAAMRPS